MNCFSIQSSNTSNAHKMNPNGEIHKEHDKKIKTAEISDLIGDLIAVQSREESLKKPNKAQFRVNEENFSQLEQIKGQYKDIWKKMNACKGIIEASTYHHAPFKLTDLKENISIAEDRINHLSQLIGTYKLQLHHANTAVDASKT